MAPVRQAPRHRRDDLVVLLAARRAAALDEGRQDRLGEGLLEGLLVGLGRARHGHRVLFDELADLAAVLIAGVAGDAVLGRLGAELPLRALTSFMVCSRKART